MFQEVHGKTLRAKGCTGGLSGRPFNPQSDASALTKPSFSHFHMHLQNDSKWFPWAPLWNPFEANNETNVSQSDRQRTKQTIPETLPERLSPENEGMFPNTLKKLLTKKHISLFWVSGKLFVASWRSLGDLGLFRASARPFFQQYPRKFDEKSRPWLLSVRSFSSSLARRYTGLPARKINTWSTTQAAVMIKSRVQCSDIR